MDAVIVTQSELSLVGWAVVAPDFGVRAVLEI